jgi:hypothetical protein
MRGAAFVLLLCVALLGVGRADLPVHCTHHMVGPPVSFALLRFSHHSRRPKASGASSSARQMEGQTRVVVTRCLTRS